MRPIDADALFEPNESTDKVLIWGRNGGKTIALAEKMMRERVNMAPTLALDDLRPQGRWVCLEPEIGYFACSECDHRILRAKCNYCPSCGADMRGGGGEDG